MMRSAKSDDAAVGAERRFINNYVAEALCLMERMPQGARDAVEDAVQAHLSLPKCPHRGTPMSVPAMPSFGLPYEKKDTESEKGGT